eukprot:gb/GFBE01001122.1/.p1 GENE.gb/GFBE01001122.1/~~gb/GFBE01001122.1/.p1  ORF type:complete len:570 (+),score=34.18 gb/GFBE01001122.1/:1-1710(+)
MSADAAFYQHAEDNAERVPFVELLRQITRAKANWAEENSPPEKHIVGGPRHTHQSLFADAEVQWKTTPAVGRLLCPKPSYLPQRDFNLWDQARIASPVRTWPCKGITSELYDRKRQGRPNWQPTRAAGRCFHARKFAVPLTKASAQRTNSARSNIRSNTCLTTATAPCPHNDVTLVHDLFVELCHVADLIVEFISRLEEHRNQSTDRYVQRHQFMKAVCHLKPGIAEHDANSIFDILGTDASGSISLHELALLLKPETISASRLSLCKKGSNSQHAAACACRGSALAAGQQLAATAPGEALSQLHMASADNNIVQAIDPAQDHGSLRSQQPSEPLQQTIPPRLRRPMSASSARTRSLLSQGSNAALQQTPGLSCIASQAQSGPPLREDPSGSLDASWSEFATTRPTSARTARSQSPQSLMETVERRRLCGKRPRPSSAPASRFPVSRTEISPAWDDDLRNVTTVRQRPASACSIRPRSPPRITYQPSVGAFPSTLRPCRPTSAPRQRPQSARYLRAVPSRPTNTGIENPSTELTQAVQCGRGPWLKLDDAAVPFERILRQITHAKILAI